MKVLVRQISSGLYWNTGTGWVQAQDAEIFPNSGAAIKECIDRGIRDVQILLSFDDPRYDVVLHPFGETGHDPSASELIEQTRELCDKNKEISERTKNLLAGAHQTIAELKERKKQRPFNKPPETQS